MKNLIVAIILSIMAPASLFANSGRVVTLKCELYKCEKAFIGHGSLCKPLFDDQFNLSKKNPRITLSSQGEQNFIVGIDLDDETWTTFNFGLVNENPEAKLPTVKISGKLDEEARFAAEFDTNVIGANGPIGYILECFKK